MQVENLTGHSVKFSTDSQKNQEVSRTSSSVLISPNPLPHTTDVWEGVRVSLRVLCSSGPRVLMFHG